MAMKSHISTHDLEPKLNQMKQWLKKSYQVKVAIDSLGDVDKTVSTVRESFEGRIVFLSFFLNHPSFVDFQKEVVAQVEQALKELGTVNQKQDSKSGVRFVLKPLLLDGENTPPSVS